MSARSVPWAMLAVTCATAWGGAGCGSGGGGDGEVPGGVAPAAPFASSLVLAVTSEATATTVTLLAVDPATGVLGSLPGSPIDLGVPITDVETLAVDDAAGRIYVGSNLAGRIACAAIGADGALAPIAGSPFAAERTAVSVVLLHPTLPVLYVGYEGEALVSRFAIDGAGAIASAGPAVATAATHVESLVVLGDFLYVGGRDTSNIVALAIDPATGALSPTGVEVATATRPDYLQTLNGRLYCSLAQAAAVDAFDVDPGSGALSRLVGAPYPFPGLGLFELIEVRPQGDLIAVGTERPAAIGLYAVAGDGSLAPSGDPVLLHDRKGGPEGLEWTPDGRFLYVADHVAPGIFVLEVAAGRLTPAAEPRYRLPGRQIDLALLARSVQP